MTLLKIRWLALFILGIASLPSMADVTALGQKEGCFVCHSIQQKMVGPSWKAVAQKYKGEKSAEAKLMKKVRHGGAGVWGAIPMPPNNQISDTDLKALVKGILTL